jgi:hypothetical protein
MHEIPDAALKELANAGSLCAECGGLHVGSIDTALRSLSVAEDTKIPMPWCSCTSCRPCQKFRETVAQVMVSSSYLDTTPHSEDAL